MKIHNYKGFSMIQLLAVILMIIIIAAGIRVSCTFTKKADAADNLKVSYTSVQVTAKDSLWSIASDYYSDAQNGTIKDYVREIKRCNGLDSDEIYAGNHIVVPIYIQAE